MTACQLCAGLTGVSRQQYQRFRGPFLEELGLADLQAQPRPWQLLLGRSAAQTAYNMPDSAAMLQERLEDNVVTFLVSCALHATASAGRTGPCLTPACTQVNYLWIAAAMALVSL